MGNAFCPDEDSSMFLTTLPLPPPLQPVGSEQISAQGLSGGSYRALQFAREEAGGAGCVMSGDVGGPSSLSMILWDE